jgi:hypothetical protein
MAKLQHTFIQGKMNKDLDERLVPNGQYRDAQNIQVSTSEGSDVGAVENILGNTKKNLRSTGPDVFWQSSFGLQNPVCIGVIKDSQNEKIYWFLNSADSSTDAIVEYDQTTGIVAPVLVDVNGVLNFNKLNLITGVNILENQLFWTDDLNEPRVINIDTFKAGSVQSGSTLNSTTHVYGATRDFIASDITVIKKAPQQVLTAIASPSIYSGPGTGITPVTVSKNLFTAEVGQVVNIGLAQSISWSGISDTTFTLTADIVNDDNSRTFFEATASIDTYTSQSDVDILIISISDDVPDLTLNWEMLLVEGEPIFKNDFPRFSYRYKYSNGEYSPYAPFSKPAFVPGYFEYLSRDGNNTGMESVIRKIAVANFQTTPKDVDEVEVLYKGSRSNNVYLIESFKYDFSAGVQPVLNVDITSGTLGRVIESSQLLRLYDAVPKKAKAQEVVANRVMYGNYVQNYDVLNSSVDIIATQNNTTHSSPVLGLPSVKTDREYQVGVTFIDDYGRETPVFTANNGAISVDKRNAPKVNSIRAKLNSFSAPSWIKKFKYYIKESTPEYYNIALDRYYEAEDGEIWLSFPSSERNKVQEGQYITLKKEHDNDTPVTINNKYKLLSVKNEVPEYISNVKQVKARSAIAARFSPTVGFELGNNKVTFNGPLETITPVDSGNTVISNSNFATGFKDTAFIQFFNESGTAASSIYQIKEGGPTGEITTNTTPNPEVEWGVYEVFLTENLKQRDNWLAQLTDWENIRAVLYREERTALPEFEGRFFAKIKPTAFFRTAVQAAFSSTVPELILDETITVSADNTGISSSADHKVIWQDALAPSGESQLPAINNFKFRLLAARTDDYTSWQASAAFQNFYKDIIEGSYIKFEYNNGNLSDDFYQIIDKSVFTSVYSRNLGAQGTGTSMQFELNRVFNDSSYSGSGGAAQFAKIKVYRERFSGDLEELSSSNPAVFETEPIEVADLDIYYEASAPIDVSVLNAYQTIDWHNCYSFGNGVESDRIRDDFNAPTLGNGVRVSSTLEEPYREERRATGLIFSGIFNSINGVNNTNQFLIAESITKDLNPTYGSIQKLHARDTDLIALLEDKCFKILANKDALFNADGNTNVTSNANVLGQTIPFVGEYGISKNPESFASFGFRAYFTDKARGAVMRLSRDGLTDISDKGMSYFFQDGLKTNVNPSIIGAYDSDAGSYNVVIGGEGISFKEKVDGWNTRLSYDPEAGISLNNEYYTFKNAELYEHAPYVDRNANPLVAVPRSNFYGVQEDTTVTPLFNDAPTSVKNFKTLSYEGDEGWIASIATNKQSGTVSTWKEREGIYFNYIMGDATTLANIDLKEFSVQGIGNVLAHSAGSTIITINGEVNVSLQPGDVIYSNAPGNTLRVIGTVLVVDRANNSIRLTSAIPGAPPAAPDFMLFAKNSQVNTSGLLGYYGEAVFSTSSSDKKELFAVNSEIFISSE